MYAVQKNAEFDYAAISILFSVDPKYLDGISDEQKTNVDTFFDNLHLYEKNPTVDKI